MQLEILIDTYLFLILVIYIQIFIKINIETKEDVGCYPYHAAKIVELSFNKDASLLLTSSMDLNVGIAKLSDKTKKIIERPNQKELTSTIFDHDGKIYTAGYDCAIRIWAN